MKLLNYIYLNEGRSKNPAMQADFIEDALNSGGDGRRQGCLACLKPAAFVGAVAKGLSLARPASAQRDICLAFRNGVGVAQVVGQLDSHTLIKRDQDGATFAATDDECWLD